MWRTLEMWMQGKGLGTCARRLVEEIATIKSMDVLRRFANPCLNGFDQGFNGVWGFAVPNIEGRFPACAGRRRGGVADIPNCLGPAEYGTFRLAHHSPLLPDDKTDIPVRSRENESLTRLALPSHATKCEGFPGVGNRRPAEAAAGRSLP